MRVRHFNPDFSQWTSDKGSYVSFPLLAIEPNSVAFDGLEYRLQGDQLHIRLDMKTRINTWCSSTSPNSHLAVSIDADSLYSVYVGVQGAGVA